LSGIEKLKYNLSKDGQYIKLDYIITPTAIGPGGGAKGAILRQLDITAKLGRYA